MQQGLATQDYHVIMNVFQQITVYFYNHKTWKQLHEDGIADDRTMQRLHIRI